MKRIRNVLAVAVTVWVVTTALSLPASAVLVQEQKISATDFALSGFYSIAISADGTRIAIGSNGAIGGGAVYIFFLSGGTWSLEQTLVGADTTAGDSFGISVSFSDDASRVLIGASLDDDGGSSSGSAYVFSRSGTVWTQEQKIVASDDAAGGNFGEHLDMSADGTRLVVGSKGIDSSRGAAYVFSRSGVTWTEEQKVTASDAAVSDQYGTSVAIDSDGTRIVAGAPGDDDGGSSSGSAYVATRSGVTWTEEQKIVASDDDAGDTFGGMADITDDGTRVIIGAGQENSYAGSAYVFSRSGVVWTEEQKLAASDGASFNFFGGGNDGGVHISSDGSSAIVSAYGNSSNRGAAYYFTRSGTVWTEEQKAVAPDGVASDFFGISADFQPDGIRFVAVAQGDDSFAGSAYVFGPGQNLSVVFAGTGTGAVDSSPVGIDGCTTDCDADFAQNAVVTLTATPDTGSMFVGWTGDVDCSDGSVTMSIAVSCTATFDLEPPPPPSGGSSGGVMPGSPLARELGLFTSPSPTPVPVPISGPRLIPADFNLREGDLISAYPAGDPDVYIVNEHGFRRLFLNPAIFGFYGHLGGYAAVRQVSPTTRDAFPVSGLFRNCETGDQDVYAAEVTAEDQGTLHHVALSGSDALAQDPDFFLKVFCINSNEFNWYPRGTSFTSLDQLPIYRR